MHPRYLNRVALITGASRGIGRAIALSLAAEGAKIIVNYARQEAAAEAVVAEIRDHGGEALAAAADVRDRTAVSAMIELGIATFGQIDVLVNNAGIEVMAPILELRDDQLDALVGGHLKG